MNITILIQSWWEVHCSLLSFPLKSLLQFTVTHSHSLVEIGAIKYLFFAQEHNIMIHLRLESQSLSHQHWCDSIPPPSPTKLMRCKKSGNLFKTTYLVLCIGSLLSDIRKWQILQRALITSSSWASSLCLETQSKYLIYLRFQYCSKFKILKLIKFSQEKQVKMNSLHGRTLLTVIPKS